VKEWFISHWQELAAYIGVGSGSAFGMKKIIDRQQDRNISNNKRLILNIESSMQKKIEGIEATIVDLNKKIMTLEHLINQNTNFDKAFNADFKEYKNSVEKQFDELKRMNQKLFNEVIDLIKNK